MSIDDTTKEFIRRRANYLCEYCHSPESICTTEFTVDHVIPKSVGGSDKVENLALACRRCNERRYNFVAGYETLLEAVSSSFL
jgi:5-methylcytosine-specific restriction endonuclease McrA